MVFAVAAVSRCRRAWSFEVLPSMKPPQAPRSLSAICHHSLARKMFGVSGVGAFPRVQLSMAAGGRQECLCLCLVCVAFPSLLLPLLLSESV